jgi:hypothetical protein
MKSYIKKFIMVIARNVDINFMLLLSIYNVNLRAPGIVPGLL